MAPNGPQLPDVRAGVVLANHYRVLSVLGAGAASIVLDTEHTTSRQRYAVKVYDPALLDTHPGGTEGFMRTAKLLSRVGGPNTIRVVAVGILPSGAPYLALEYLIGVDLRSMLAESGAVWFTEAAQYVVQACESLEQAHALGLIHRELRPSNMFIVEPSEGHRILKVANYSIGTIIDGPTASGADDRASIEYAAPEVLRGKPVDARADVWALGVTFFELVAGKRPFSTADLGRMFETNAPVVPPPLASPHGVPIPAEFNAWVRKCLAEEPDDRFPTARETKLALLRIMQPASTLKLLGATDSADHDSPWSGDPTRVDARALAAPAAETLAAEPVGATRTGKLQGTGQAHGYVDDNGAGGTGTVSLYNNGAAAPQDRVHDPAPSSARGTSPRPAFSDRTVEVPENATLVQESPFTNTSANAAAFQLPDFVVKEMPSSRGRTIGLGALALVVIVVLPLFYIYDRARHTEDVPEPAVSVDDPSPSASSEDVTLRVEHQRGNPAASSSAPQRFFMVPPVHPPAPKK